MGAALGWGAFAASSVFIGALLGCFGTWPSKPLGMLLGFGAGALFSAISFDLFNEGFNAGGAGAVTAGLAAGAEIAALEALFDRVVAIANDLGLLAEEFDTVACRQTGNFPQALTHLAVVNTALTTAFPQVRAILDAPVQMQKQLDLLRIGASSVLNDLLMQYAKTTSGRYGRAEDFSKE